MKERHIKKGLEPQDLLFHARRMKENEALRIICKTDLNENIQLLVIFICYKIYMYYRVRSHIILYIVIL